jgi:hypothetical protein
MFGSPVNGTANFGINEINQKKVPENKSMILSVEQSSDEILSHQ